MEPPRGFEPRTPSLPWMCSTPELRWRISSLSLTDTDVADKIHTLWVYDCFMGLTLPTLILVMIVVLIVAGIIGIVFFAGFLQKLVNKNAHKNPNEEHSDDLG